MKTAQWRRIVRPLLPADRNWGEAGRAFYMTPVTWVATGILAEPSRWDSSTRVHLLMSPLMPPFPTFVGGFAPLPERFFDEEEMGAAVAESLRAVPDESEALRRIASMPAKDEAERIGYCRFLTGDRDGAQAALAAVEQRRGRRYDWEIRQAERVGKVLDLLRDGKDDLVLATLDSWANETAEALGVERFVPGRPLPMP